MGVVINYGNVTLPQSDHGCKISIQDQKGSITSRVSIQSTNKPVQECSDLEMRIEDDLSFLKYKAQTAVCDLPSMDDLLGVMQMCNKSSNLAYAECLHIYMHGFGLEAYDVPGTHLVSTHMACGNIDVAERVFQKLLYWDVYAWTSLLSGYVELGDYIHALDLIPMIQASSASLDTFAFLSLLKASTRLKYGKQGLELHMYITKQGLDYDSFLGNSLVDMYVKCGLLAEARQAFDRLPAQDVISWNTLLAGYVEHDLIEQALDGFQQMHIKGIPPNGVTYTCSLKACGCIGALEKGYELHTSILKEGFDIDAFVSSSLVDMYARCNSQEEAHRVFDAMSNKSVVAWTALIAGYAKQGLTSEALYCLQQMRLESVVPNAITFVCILKACCVTGALDKGQQVHAAVVIEGFEKNIFVCNTLVDMYIKCNSFADAQEVFNEAAIRDVALWNVIISGYAEHGFEHEAIAFLDRMQVEGVPSSAASLISILKCCDTSKDVIHSIHSRMFKYGFESDSFIGSSLVDAYSKAGLLAEAQNVFDTLQQQCVVSWNAIIDGYAELGLGHEALKCLEEMRSGEVSANAVTYLCGLKACASIGAVEEGLQIHACIVKLGFEHDDFVGNSLVAMYAKCGLLAEAQEEFNNLVNQNSVSYVALLAGYVECGLVEEALQCLENLQTEIFSMDSVSYGCILKACGAIGALQKGQEIHTEVAKEAYESDHLVVMNLMVMYVKNGLLVEAQDIFDNSSFQNDVVLWSILIEGYADQGLGQKALSCWDQMQSNNVSLDNVSFVGLLRACAIVRGLERGQEIHCKLVIEGLETDHFIGNTLIDMYAKCHLRNEAQEGFDELRVRDRVSWNILILSCADEQEESESAFPLYQQMLEQGITPDSATLVNVLTACGNAAALEVGKRIHAQICALQDFEDVEPVLTSAIIDMYGKCGSMTNAQQVFDTLLACDQMTWTTLIFGYARQGESELAMLMFDRMREEGIHPSGITYMSVLTACSHNGLVEKGHEYYEAMSREYSIVPTLVHHNCMLALLGRAGQLKEALLMIEELPAQPDATTWSTVLSACQMWAHMEVGKDIFDSRVSLDKMSMSAFIMMSNMYADATN